MKPEARLEVANNSRYQAESYLNQNNPGRAFAHFLVALNLCPNWKNELKLKFSSTLCSWGTELEAQKRYKDLFHCYEQALEVFPDCEEVLNNLGAHLLRLGHVREASHYFRKALMVDPDFLPARRNLQTVSNLVVERWHFRMLNDRLRNEAFREALFKKVKQKFDTILDIGTGTGILSMFAAKAGAKSIHSCEVSPTMYQIAKDVIKANNFSGSICLLNKLSYDLQIPKDMPERVSLVVTETMDCGLLGEHVLTILSDAWKRLLLPPCEGFRSMKKISSHPSHKQSEGEETGGEEDGGVCSPAENTSQTWSRCFWRYQPGGSMEGHGIVIPFGASVCLAGIECLNLSLHYRLLPSAFCRQHLKFPSMLTASSVSNNGGEELYDAEDLLQLPSGFRYLVNAMEATYVNFNDPEEIDARLSGGFPPEVLQVKVSSSGRMDAIAAWFILDVDEDIKLVTAPGKGSCWEQALYPLYTPINVIEGQIVEYSISNSGKKLAVNVKIVEKLDCDEEGALETTSDFVKAARQEGLETGKDVERIEEEPVSSVTSPQIEQNSDAPGPSGAEDIEHNLSKLMTNLATSTAECLPSPFSLSENAIAFLNNDLWIEGIVRAAEKIAESGKIETVLDISPFPVFGLQLLKLGGAKRMVWSPSLNGTQNIDDERILKEVAALNGIETENVICQPEESIQEEFDIIYIDIVDTTGELLEGAIGKLPSLIEMLKPNGILLPEKITVVAQLLYSKWLARMSHVLSDENVCNYKISEFINVYKVPQHLDVDMNALSNDVCCEPMKVIDLNVRQLAADNADKNCEIVEMKVPKKCNVNSIVHWYEVTIVENILVCSFGVNGHCKQVATLLPSEIEVTSEEKLLMKIIHHQGLLHLQVIECLPQLEEATQATKKE